MCKSLINYTTEVSTRIPAQVGVYWTSSHLLMSLNNNNKKTKTKTKNKKLHLCTRMIDFSNFKTLGSGSAETVFELRVPQPKRIRAPVSEMIGLWAPNQKFQDSTALETLRNDMPLALSKIYACLI